MARQMELLKAIIKTFHMTLRNKINLISFKYIPLTNLCFDCKIRVERN